MPFTDHGTPTEHRPSYSVLPMEGTCTGRKTGTRPGFRDSQGTSRQIFSLRGSRGRVPSTRGGGESWREGGFRGPGPPRPEDRSRCASETSVRGTDWAHQHRRGECTPRRNSPGLGDTAESRRCEPSVAHSHPRGQAPPGLCTEGRPGGCREVLEHGPCRQGHGGAGRSVGGPSARADVCHRGGIMGLGPVFTW